MERKGMNGKTAAFVIFVWISALHCKMKRKNVHTHQGYIILSCLIMALNIFEYIQIDYCFYMY